MLSRLKYLYSEGFDVCSIMGYDADTSFELGEGKILYRTQNTEGQWRLCTEAFEVSYDEMQACASLYLTHVLK
jgi:hypothetical protein